MANSDDGSEEDEYWQNYRYSAAFRRASFHPPDEVWTLFSEAEDCCEIIDYFKALTKVTNIDPNLKGIKFYEVLKSKLTSWKCQSLWDLLNARLKHREYQNGTVCKDLNCLIIGAGPIGLRTAIEFLFLGCSRVTIVEQRTEFSRNNVLHLWPFLLTDFKALGAKKFYGKFGAGCIDHINIRTLQCILLKVALVLGCDIHIGVTFKKMVEPRDKNVGWTVHLEPENLSISKVPFDVVIGADGKKNVLPGFPQIELRGALAIGITCNFVNNNTIEEARVPEISGVSYQFNPTFFKDMEAQYGVKLENIVYYKNETHYFVMTALKSSLLNLGVLKQEVSDPRRLLESSNIDKDKLVKFTLSAVNFATDHQLPKVEFKKLSNGKPDIALFDFTSIKKAANASRIIERQNKKLLLALVGDSLIEPFWPTGSGCGRGVLSALDVAWMVRQFALKHPPLSVLRERENVFKLLSGTNNDSLQKSYKSFTIDPKSRYKGFDTKRVSNMTSLKGLYDTDDPDHADFTVISPMPSNEPSPVKKTAAQRRRSSSGSSRKVTSTHLHPHLTSTLSSGKKKRSDKTKDQQTVGSTKAFWEEHNKKNYEEKAKSHVTKKRSATLSGDIDDIEEAEEALSDLEDDVIVDELTDNNNFKRGPVPLASNNTKETKKNDKIKYQAKGGGLRARREASKKTPEKPTTTEVKSRRRSTGSKKNLHRRKVTKSESEDIPPKKENKASVKKEESKRLVDSRSFFKKWVEDLTAKYKAFSSSNEPNGALDICTRNAIMSLAAVPLLMDCNRPPPRRTTDIKLKDINKAKESFLNQTNNRLETKEISVKRAGSVKNTVAKYKMLVKEEEKKDDYYEFIRRTSLKTKLMKNDEEIDETDRALPECEPREVIDVEKALLSQDEDEERRSRLSKSSWNGPLSQTSNIELNLALLEFCDYQTPLNSIYMLQVLYNVHRRILDAPTIDKYYRIYVKGNIFERYVWLLEGSEDFMNKAGWVKCGNYLVLSKSYPVKQSISVIEDVLKRKKKAQIIYSGSVQNQTRKGDVSVRRAKSSVNTKIDENEVLSTYANIDSPTRLHESDSAFGSGFEDNDEPFPPENRKLRRVESRERVVGNEQYVVVDFVGNLEFKSVVKRPSDDESPDSTALSVSPTMSVHSAFEEISTSDFNSPDSPSSVSIATESDDRLEIPAAKSKKIVAPVEESDIVEAVERATEEAPSFEKLSSLEEPRENEIEAQPKYRATKGLKQAKQEKAREKLETESDKENIKVSVPDTRPSPTFGNRARRSDSSASNSSVSSYTSSRKTSLRSNASDAGTKSIVMQNKLLFDKQIAEENKRKYGSMTSLDSKPKKLDTSLFERNNSLRNSFSKSQQQMEGSDDIRISGIVAGTREMFENDKSRSVTGLSYRKRDNDVIRKESFKRNNEEISTYVKTTNDANDEIIATIANKESVTSGSLKKKKKGIFKKKRKTESKYSPNKNTEEIENVKDNTENNPQDDDHNKKGFFARIRKRSKSQESDSKASKQNSIEIEIPTENEIIFDDTTSEMTSPRFNDISVTHDDSNNDIKVSADLENNVSVTEESSEKSYAVSMQNDFNKDDSTTMEMQTDNILENHNDDANFLEDDHDVMVETGLQNDLQAIANRQSSSKSKKKNVFKKKKKSKSEKNEDLLEGKLDTNISPVITVGNESSIDQNNDIVADNDVAYNANHDIQADISLPTIDEKTVHESDIKMDEELPNTQFTVKSEDIDKNIDDRDLASIDANIDTTADLGKADISLNRDVDNENQNNHDSTINVTTPTNNIGELVFERPTGVNSAKDSSLVLPQISITDEDHVANSNDNIPINDDDKRSSLEGSDDELVRALDLANKIPSAIDDDTTSYTSYASSVTSTKKKKKFPFHLKGSSKKEKKDKKEANGDPKNLSVKSSKKNKRPKSLDLSNTDLSLSSSNLDISSIDSPEKSKKKRMGLFRSKKKKNGSTDSPTKLSPEKAKPFPNSHAENTASQHTLLSSDEFTIPENNLVESDVSANISVDLRKSDANEYSKQSSLIEIQRSEEMEF